LDFIYTHISYEEEIDDVFLAPVETLGFKSGDCDDFSILAAAFFEEAGIDAAESACGCTDRTGLKLTRKIVTQEFSDILALNALYPKENCIIMHIIISAIARPTTISGLTLIPGVSSSKNLSRPAPAAGIGDFCCLRFCLLPLISDQSAEDFPMSNDDMSN
jgi:hypothetical protein